MIKAVIFDLNGVFIVSPKLSERLECDFGVPKDEFIDALKKNMDKLRRPGVFNMDLWRPYFDKWDLRFNEEEFYDYWFSGEKENKELVSFARRLKSKGVKLFILSNNFEKRAKYYKKTFPFLDEVFEKVYYSWQTGFVKPSTEAIKKILTENDLSPEECIYFDNSGENVDVALSLGLESLLLNDGNVEEMNGIIEKKLSELKTLA